MSPMFPLRAVQKSANISLLNLLAENIIFTPKIRLLPRRLLIIIPLITLRNLHRNFCGEKRNGIILPRILRDLLKTSAFYGR